MTECCPYYDMSTGECRVARALRLCNNGSGSCATTMERCCGVVELRYTGSRAGLWETCRFYLHAADCRYCKHFDAKRSWCKMYKKKVQYYTGTCPNYDGPRPVPSLVVRR